MEQEKGKEEQEIKGDEEYSIPAYACAGIAYRQP
jgi:hypothetical protein